MRFDKLSYQSTRRSVVGFTLVEMLIVIVIIVIVAAIIFPVFKTVLERSRQSTSISNLSQIGQALAKYQLDHDGHSPPVLFGYADAGGSMQSGYAASVTAGSAALVFPGLYPAYVKDASVFIDPDNQSANTATVSPSFNVLCPNSDSACDTQPAGTLVEADHTQTVNTTTPPSTIPLPSKYYSLDSYDLSPRVIGLNSINTANLIPRYQTSWTSLDSHFELRQPNPNGNTCVTLTTYHVDHSGILLALFEDGSVHTIPSKQLINLGGDVTSIAASGGTSPAMAWKLLPGGGAQQ